MGFYRLKYADQIRIDQYHHIEGIKRTRNMYTPDQTVIISRDCIHLPSVPQLLAITGPFGPSQLSFKHSCNV